jgi:hypothetical protein
MVRACLQMCHDVLDPHPTVALQDRVLCFDTGHDRRIGRTTALWTVVLALLMFGRPGLHIRVYDAHVIPANLNAFSRMCTFLRKHLRLEWLHRMTQRQIVMKNTSSVTCAYTHGPARPDVVIVDQVSDTFHAGMRGVYTIVVPWLATDVARQSVYSTYSPLSMRVDAHA